jgi:hypothetical protein
LRSRFVKKFLIVLLIVHLPLVGFLAPILRVVLLLPTLAWVNVPGTPLGLVLGEPLYEFHEFGVVPQNTLAWALIEVGWITISLAISAAWVKLRRHPRASRR